VVRASDGAPFRRESRPTRVSRTLGACSVCSPKQGRDASQRPHLILSSFANYAGVAPIEVASGDHARHRVPGGGDRQLHLALHIVALTQVRMRESTGRPCYDTTISAGKSHNEAMHRVKHRLAERVWRLSSLTSTFWRQAREDTRGRL
jgi:transposase